MNGKTLSRKRLPLFWGEATRDLRGSLHGLSTAPPGLCFPAKPWRSNRSKAPEGVSRPGTPPALLRRASLTKAGFEMVELPQSSHVKPAGRHVHKEPIQ